MSWAEDISRPSSPIRAVSCTAFVLSHRTSRVKDVSCPSSPVGAVRLYVSLSLSLSPSLPTSLSLMIWDFIPRWFFFGWCRFTIARKHVSLIMAIPLFLLGGGLVRFTSETLSLCVSLFFCFSILLC